MKTVDALFVGFVMGALLVGSFVGMIVEQSWHKGTIEKGHALYCPTSGKWAWKGDCNE